MPVMESKPVTLKRRKVSTYEWTCKCERCSHEWKKLGDEPPPRCPKCKARNWEREAAWERPDRRSRDQ